ncbi:hypothetical protein VUR80DRAFT_7411 [Thermomyces stellatus]
MGDSPRAPSPRRSRSRSPRSSRDFRDRDSDRRDRVTSDYRDRRDTDRYRDDRDSSRRDSDRGRERERGEGQRERERRPKTGGFRWKDKRRDEDGGRGDRGRFRDDRGRDNGPTRHRSPPREKRRDGEKKEKKEKKAAAKSPEPMIVVNVNDRLGTKAAVPCFASDRIREFKILVAARVGREPHEILLKRQGERPFKDQLTLEDYGISNGVQLDLEVDTGD